MPEFRFTGVAPTGQLVQGVLFAPNRRAARQKARELARQHRFSLRSLEPRQVFLYKARHPSGRLVKGEQRAYSKAELVRALENLGLQVIRVERKLLELQLKPSSAEVILFVRLAANLLQEKLPFDEVLSLLVHDVQSPVLKQTIRDIQGDLKRGVDARTAFMKHQHVLGRFTAYMLGMGTQSGNMAEIFEATARFLERREDFRKSLRSALITPAITLLVLIGAFVYYIWHIFPETARLFQKFGMALPPLTAATLRLADWLDRYGLGLAAAFGLLLAGFWAWSRTPQGRLFVHRQLIRIPVIGPLLHKIHIEIFCRVFGVLYSGAGENIEVMRLAAEACGNAHMERQIKTRTIPLLLGQGLDLVRAMEASGVFTPMALARFRAGAETGTVRKSAQQMADYYERETGLRLKVAVEAIQVAIAFLLTIAILILTLISSEIALVSPNSGSYLR
ncbi:MAG: type II secretion system F family protein [Bacteroidetes bacterium]|nr:type II secretion system F family protein [Rhodothermia bacterium]MCS7155223.1 type II secretion system F family protein [Bacteroidota bacterium]MCX7907808.1 type II secretion system F family protein [Bacteroidota bacterium]MDW8138627.1 type II secretion system F family protein [Bacteroidota bacterium]MDW8284787.1 type II secretion system F family protein [Bacteroidota bacterium]